MAAALEGKPNLAPGFGSSLSLSPGALGVVMDPVLEVLGRPAKQLRNCCSGVIPHDGPGLWPLSDPHFPTRLHVQGTSVLAFVRVVLRVLRGS